MPNHSSVSKILSLFGFFDFKRLFADIRQVLLCKVDDLVDCLVAYTNRPQDYVVGREVWQPHVAIYGGGNHGQQNGFAALGKSIGTPKSSVQDSAYVTEHPVLKYFRAKLANFLNDFRRAGWFDRFGLPVSNGRHNQLSKSQVRLLMRRVEQRACPQGGGRGRERPEVQVFSRLDIGHKDFLGAQFVNCRPFGTHHEQVLIF